MNKLTTLIRIAIIASLFLLLVSCSGGVYSYYPKAKAKTAKQFNKKKPNALKVEILTQKQLLPVIQNGADSISILRIEPVKNRALYPIKKISRHTIIKRKEINKNSSEPGDVTHVNKEAKVAFWFAIGAVATAVAGLWLTPFLFGISVVCATISFLYALKALKKIKKTGEYGKPKAEFALVISLPILFVALCILFVVVLGGGGGFQLGDTVLFY